MKRYSVNKVVRMENHMDYLNYIKEQRLDELYSLPLVGLACMGLILSTSIVDGKTLLSLIGAGTTLCSAGGIGYLFSADQIRGNLRKKLNYIYETMGPQFENEVNEELYNQMYEDDELSR